MLAECNMSHVDQEQCENRCVFLSASIAHNSHILATLDTHDDETDEGANKDSHVAVSDKLKAQDVTHNIAHELTHHDIISHTSIDQLSLTERQNIRSLSSSDSRQSQKTQERICAQRSPQGQKAGGPGAKRAGAKAVKKMEQHSTQVVQ